MSKSSNPPVPKVEIRKSTTTGEFETKILTKSDWPKTPKETIKMAINFFLNFFPF
jgi:hypothetical protein